MALALASGSPSATPTLRVVMAALPMLYKVEGVG